MIPQVTIQEAIDRLVIAYNPLEIYLYGSYAWGNPDDEDDLNLLVIVESSNEPKVHKRGWKAFTALLGLEVPINVVIFTKQEFDTFIQDATSLTFEIKSRGKMLYARS